MNEVVPSLSDIAAVTNCNRGNNNGFGGDGSWAWIIIFLIFAWGGFGRNGNGFGGSNGGGVADNYVLASDFANISRQIDSTSATTERKLDSISNGICSLGYDQLREINGINTNLMNNGYETRLAVTNLGSQLADCCCGLQRGIDGVNYNMAMNTNNIQNSMCNNTRDIIESQNCNTRQIVDLLNAQRLEDKNIQIQMQQNEINALRLKASQEAQNRYLVGELAPKCPIPAFLTCNPYTGQSYTNGFGYGYNSGCGCNGNII